MIRLIVALILSASHQPIFAAIERPGTQYYRKTLTCVGVTADVWVGTSGFYCQDEPGHRYYGYMVGVGYGGLFTGSVFQLYARLAKGHPIEGRYSGPSAAVALIAGVGAGYFARNSEGGWRPDFQAEEYIYAIGFHLGMAGDLSTNTFYLERL